MLEQLSEVAVRFVFCTNQWVGSPMCACKRTTELLHANRASDYPWTQPVCVSRTSIQPLNASYYMCPCECSLKQNLEYGGQQSAIVVSTEAPGSLVQISARTLPALHLHVLPVLARFFSQKLSDRVIGSCIKLDLVCVCMFVTTL